MALAPGLAPGMLGWQQADASRNENATNALRMMSMMTQNQLAQTQVAEAQRNAASKNALAGIMKDLPKREDGSFDMQAAVPKLLQAGPAGLEVINHLVKVNESLEGQRMLQDLSGAGQNPDKLRAIGLRQGALGKPGGAAFVNAADREELKLRERAAAEGMRSAPGVTPNTPNDDNGNPMPVIPPKLGFFAALAGSKYPEVASQAKSMQGQVDAGAMMPPEANKISEQLTSLANSRSNSEAIQNAVGARADKSNQIKLTIHNTPTGGTAPAMSTDALEVAAHRYFQDGTLPPNMGRGAQGAANTQKVLERAAAIATSRGMDAEALRINQTANKGLQTAVGALERQRAQVLTYEKTALGGADIALEMSGKVDRTGVPLINKWVNAGRQNILGDPDVTRLNNAVETFTNEYAKVMSGSSGGQATTVSMQEHARKMLNGAMTKEQFAKTVDLMKREMTQTRETAFDAQITEMRDRMKTGAVSAPQRRASDKAPTAGAVQDGYRFKGGNPADPKSWEKM